MSGFLFRGMRVIQSVYATRDGGPVKLYPKRKAKTPAHLKRMRKKWLKRYGIKHIPCAYQMQAGLVREPTLVIHPTLWAAYKQHLERDKLSIGVYRDNPDLMRGYGCEP